MPGVADDEWTIAESYARTDMDEQGVTPEWLSGKWMNVAEDMALIPENNVRVVEEDGVVRVEVSVYLMECMRGF